MTTENVKAPEGYIPPVAGAILYNTATCRYHPIIYRDSPSIGDTPTSRRLKSIGHHTAGFESQEEAFESFNDWRFEGTYIKRDGVLDWDGIDIPADVAWFVDGRLLR